MGLQFGLVLYDDMIPAAAARPPSVTFNFPWEESIMGREWNRSGIDRPQPTTPAPVLKDEGALTVQLFCWHPSRRRMGVLCHQGRLDEKRCKMTDTLTPRGERISPMKIYCAQVFPHPLHTLTATYGA